MNKDMDQLFRPKILPGHHPIEDKKSQYLIPTPAIYELSEAVENWMENYNTGAMIYGSQRMGKTSAIRFIKKELEESFEGRGLVYFIPMVSQKVFSVGDFFSHLLNSVDHSIKSTGTIFIKRLRLHEYIVQKTKDTKDRRIVFFIDEAQKLNLEHFDYLVDIHNQLEAEKVFATMLLVGQPELLIMRNTFERLERMNIIGRFMAQEFRFFGIRNPAELEVVLQGYDEAEYPQESKCSFTRYYFPAAFDFGWRLAQEAENLWLCFSEIRKRHQVPVKEEIPMEYVVETVKYLLKKFSDLSSSFLGFNMDQCKKAIESSGYIGGSRYLVLRKNLEEF